MTRRGFTLVETLIALGLIALLTGLMLDFGLNLSDRRDSLATRGTRQHAVTAVFHRIDRALTAADANGSGIRVSPHELVITSRSVLARPSTEEYDVQTIGFDHGSSSLAASSSQRDGSTVAQRIEHATFSAFDGSSWGPFDGSSLPQAVAVSVWYQMGTPPSAEDTFDDPRPVEERRGPDRWRVFSLVDTLPEVGA